MAFRSPGPPPKNLKQGKGKVFHIFNTDLYWLNEYSPTNASLANYIQFPLILSVKISYKILRTGKHEA